MRQHKIAWLNMPGFVGETLNPIKARKYVPCGDTERIGWHCEKISLGCANCYAETLNGRFGTQEPFTAAGRDQISDIFLDEFAIRKPLAWKNPRAIFWGDMSDLFGEWVKDEWLDLVLAVVALTPQHRHLFLTKRTQRMAEYFAGIYSEDGDLAGVDGGHRIGAAAGCLLDGLRVKGPGYPARKRVEEFIADTHADASGLDYEYRPQPVPWPLPNLWVGATVENQAAADERIPQLLKIPAAVRFLSCEPLLGPIDLRQWLEFGFGGPPWLCRRSEHPEDQHTGNSDAWVIAGGESGPHARPSHPDWFRSLRDQCRDAGVPFFFKGWGEFREYDNRIDPLGSATGELPSRVMRLRRDGTDLTHTPLRWHVGDEFMIRAGKARAGCRLDGREHKEMPNGRV